MEKSKLLSVRVTPEFIQHIDAAAMRSDKHRSDFVRELVARHLPPVEVKPAKPAKVEMK